MISANNTNTTIGIEAIGLYVPRYYVSLNDLAVARQVDPAKFSVGIGQELMAVPPPDEDVVSLGANAAHEALMEVDRDRIDTLMFATESGVDQSKAAAIYAHHLLDLPRRCKSFEIKQACCGSTAALQMALALVAQKPDRKVLIIASDIARYGLGTAGEPTQGAGAVALVISAQPRIMAFDPEWGSYTEDVMDFWRPNYMDEAVVDGKYSIKIYLKALAESWAQYHEESGRGFDAHQRFCYHMPFTRMAEKAHRQLAKLNGIDAVDAEAYADGLRYNRITGNSYTASLYIGLTSLLESSTDLTGYRIGHFSYGSGCMAAYFSGVVLPGYQVGLQPDRIARQFETRRRLNVEMYEAFYRHEVPRDGSRYLTPQNETGRFRFSGVQDHKRLYEMNPVAVPAIRLPAYAVAS
jgi:hydroxymethylglutaryl-CoA synthase